MGTSPQTGPSVRSKVLCSHTDSWEVLPCSSVPSFCLHAGCPSHPGPLSPLLCAHVSAFSLPCSESLDQLLWSLPLLELKALCPFVHAVTPHLRWGGGLWECLSISFGPSCSDCVTAILPHTNTNPLTPHLQGSDTLMTPCCHSNQDHTSCYHLSRKGLWWEEGVTEEAP